MPDDTPNPELVQAVTKALETGNKILAIKVYREATGKNLRECKDFVDALIPRLIEKDPQRYAKLSSTGSGCSAAVLMVTALGSVVTVIIILLA